MLMLSMALHARILGMIFNTTQSLSIRGALNTELGLAPEHHSCMSDQIQHPPKTNRQKNPEAWSPQPPFT